MSTQPKNKLCWNCEGRVSFQDENCPYCGVYLSPLNSEEAEEKSSLFSAPYRPDQPGKEEQSVPAAPYKTQEKSKPVKTQEPVKPSEDIARTSFISNEARTIVLPLILLLSGSVFFLFGIALLLFSQNGVFTLQWNSNYWYVCFLLAIPMLFFGWRALQQDSLDSNL